MEGKEKIEIPEDLQQICKDLAKVAQAHGLYELKGSFRPNHSSWGGEIHFGWKAGRHNEDSNEINISSTFNVFTRIKENGKR